MLLPSVWEGSGNVDMACRTVTLCFEHVLVDLISGRIKPAPNRGYHFVSPPPLFQSPPKGAGKLVRREHLSVEKYFDNFRKVALQTLHCNIRFSAARTSFLPKAALQQTRNCTATLKSGIGGKWRFPAALLWISSSHV